MNRAMGFSWLRDLLTRELCGRQLVEVEALEGATVIAEADARCAWPASAVDRDLRRPNYGFHVTTMAFVRLYVSVWQNVAASRYQDW